jgi:hypothetical protein
MAEHAKPPVRRDRLWVLAALSLIVACGLLEVWASWLMIGSVSGFPKLGPMTTGWILPVTTEAYWTVALFAWLADPSGPRSRRFAMSTAVVVFALSLTGQELSHLLAAAHGRPPAAVVMFVTALPLVAVGLGAILIHLRQLDREEAHEAAEAGARAALLAAAERAEADERTRLRAELGDLKTALKRAEAERDATRAEAETALASARDELGRAVAKTEALARKLAGSESRKPGGSAGRKPARKTAAATGSGAGSTAGPETAEGDPAELVLKLIEGGLSASQAGRRAGLSDSRGRQIWREARARTAPQDAVADQAQA